MIEIRPAIPSDTPAIHALLAQLGYTLDPALLAHRIAALAATGTDPILVATDGPHCLGVLALHITPMLQLEHPAARITALVIDATARGRNIGRQLVARAGEHAEQAGCHRIELTTGLDREDAHAFYKAIGFTATSLRFARKW